MSLPADLAPVIQQVQAANAALDSILTWINGEPARIAAAQQAALSGGASAMQLQPLITAINTQQTKVQQVLAAMEANTPVFIA